MPRPQIAVVLSQCLPGNVRNVCQRVFATSHSISCYPVELIPQSPDTFSPLSRILSSTAAESIEGRDVNVFKIESAIGSYLRVPRNALRLSHNTGQSKRTLSQEGSSGTRQHLLPRAASDSVKVSGVSEHQRQSAATILSKVPFNLKKACRPP